MLSRVCCVLFGLWVIAGYVPKICVNCKYYLLSSVANSPEYGKCKKYPIDIGVSTKYLVAGTKEPPSYMYCSTVRTCDSMCGQKGKDYMRARAKPKTSPKPKPKSIEPITNTSRIFG